MYRTIVNLEEARRIIEPYAGKVIQCIQDSFDKYLNISQHLKEDSIYITLKTRTKAGIIHDIITSYITDSFKGLPNIEAKEYNRIFGLNIDNKLFVRFKKMDRSFGVSALKTKQHKKFMGQKQIDGFPERPTFLFAGYIPNESWTGLAGIYLACWNGENLLWFDEAGEYSFEQLVIPLNAPHSYVQTEIEKKVKLSKKARKKDTGTDN